MKQIVIFTFLLLISLSSKTQGDSESLSKLNYRESVFTEDLRNVFVFRKENLGNVFVYDVASNTMIKEINTKNGVILKVIPKADYLILLTTNALEVYDIKTFGMYYELPFTYKVAEKKGVKEVPMPKKDKKNPVAPSPDWLKIKVEVTGDMLACKWDDGQIMVWNWKTRKLLHQEILKKNKFKQIKGDIGFGTFPTRILIKNDDKVTLYDSIMRIISTNNFSGDYTTCYYNDAGNDVAVLSMDIKIAKNEIELKTDSYKEDLSTKISSVLNTFKIFGNKQQNVVGTFGSNIIIEEKVKEKDIELEYKNFDHNLQKVIIQDVASGKELYSFPGSYATISPDGTKIIIKRVKGQMPEYRIKKYTSFFKKRSKSMAGNRYTYKYKREVESITYQQIIDLKTGKEIISIDTGDPLYYYKSMYILQNSHENGGLKLYDFNTGQLIKEI